MSAARKTLKILALIYFVLGIASLVIGIAGIATGNLDSTYGSNAMLAAVVLVAKGLIDLAAGVAGIKGANKPSQVDAAFKLGIVAAIATIAQAVVDGNSHFYVTLAGDATGTIYDFALPELLEIVAYQPGDQIAFRCVEKSEEAATVTVSDLL